MRRQSDLILEVLIQIEKISGAQLQGQDIAFTFVIYNILLSAEELCLKGPTRF